MILWVNSDLVSDGGRCHVSCYESVGASRHHIEPSCRVSDDALRRRPDVGCRTKFVAHPGGGYFLPWLVSTAVVKIVLFFNAKSCQNHEGSFIYGKHDHFILHDLFAKSFV